MSALHIIELQAQISRRDARIAELEALLKKGMGNELLQALINLRDCIESGRASALSDANHAIRRAEGFAS